MTLVSTQGHGSSPNLQLHGTGTGGGSNGNGMMKNSLKILFVAVLSFIGGMQLDRGFIVQIYFDDSKSEMPVIRSTNIRSDSDSTNKNNNNINNYYGAAEIMDEEDVKEEEEEKRRDDIIMAKPVEKIVLLGERHGGTNWITDHLADCFGDRVEVRGSFLYSIDNIICEPRG
jgi:hypothetical protein